MAKNMKKNLMTNEQKIQEFEKVMDKGFIDYFGSQTGGFVPKHYKERFKSFLTLALTEYKKQSSCCIHCVNKTSLKEDKINQMK